MIERLKILQQQRGRFSNGREAASCFLKDQELKHEIEVLARVFLEKSVSGCGDCYSEAYAKLMNLKIEEAMSKLECNFKLRAGALLEDINDSSKTISQANITDELALHHLSNAKELGEKALARIKALFIQIQENWEQMISEKVIDEIQEEDSEDEELSEFTEDEEKVIDEIQVLLSDKTSKTDIKAKYAKIELIGEKKFTGVLLTSLIKEAENRNSKSE